MVIENVQIFDFMHSLLIQIPISCFLLVHAHIGSECRSFVDVLKKFVNLVHDFHELKARERENKTI